MPLTSTENLKQKFDSDGLAFIPSFRSKLEIADIQNNLERIIGDVVPTMPVEHVFYEDKQDLATLKQLQNLHLHDEYFGQLMSNSPFRELAENLLDSKVVCKNMQYFNKPPKTGLATPPHQDGYYFKISPCEAITMWLALEPVDHENGCVRYIPRSHLEPMRPHASTGTLGFSQGITDFPTAEDSANEISFSQLSLEVVQVFADPSVCVGTSIPLEDAFCDRMHDHRTANQSKIRTRKAIGLIYYREDVTEDLDARAAYQGELIREMKAKQRI